MYPGLILVGVSVQRRTVAGGDHILECGQRPTGLVTSHLERKRAASRSLDCRAFAGLQGSWTFGFEHAASFVEKYVQDKQRTLQGFSEWNPFIVRAAGRLQVSERLVVTRHPPGRREATFRPTVMEMTRNRKLLWLGHLGIPGIFDGDHVHELELAGIARTKYI